MQFLDDSHGCAGWNGEMAGRIRAFDWSLTELGNMDTWPRSLCSAVQLMLASPLPMVMLWGRPGYMIYNDAYSKFAGGRHPYLLGSPVELGWPEVAEFNRHVVDTCLAGGTLSYRNKVLELLRDGVPEDVWLDLYYSPVADDDGKPAGVMAMVVENLKANRSRLEDALLEVLARVETAESENASSQQALARSEARRAAEETDLARESERLNAAIASSDSRRTAQKAKILPRSLTVYEEVRRRHSGNAVARIAGGNCAGCRVAVPETVRRRAFSGDELAQCPNCGRILYVG